MQSKAGKSPLTITRLNLARFMYRRFMRDTISGRGIMFALIVTGIPLNARLFPPYGFSVVGMNLQEIIVGLMAITRLVCIRTCVGRLKRILQEPELPLFLAPIVLAGRIRKAISEQRASSVNYGQNAATRLDLTRSSHPTCVRINMERIVSKGLSLATDCSA